MQCSFEVSHVLHSELHSKHWLESFKNKPSVQVSQLVEEPEQVLQLESQ